MNADEMTADLRELVGENSTAFVWTHNNIQHDYVGVFSTQADANRIGVGGFIPDDGATLYCVLADLTAGPPTVGNKLRINGRWWRVVRTELDDDRVGISFTLESADR
jgi:hypothetical protein